MGRTLRWGMVALRVGIIGVAPVLFYRSVYGHDKRLRVVTLTAHYEVFLECARPSTSRTLSKAFRFWPCGSMAERE